MALTWVLGCGEVASSGRGRLGNQGGVMRRLILFGALAMVLLGVLSGGAAGQTGARDFAVGGGNDGVGHFSFSAHQRLLQQASGHMNYRSPTLDVAATTSCLIVRGNEAFMLGDIEQDKSSGVPAGADRVAFVVSDVPGLDGFEIFFASPGLGGCLEPFPGFPIVSGNIVVTDRAP
jgi:hypothetical protein